LGETRLELAKHAPNRCGRDVVTRKFRCSTCDHGPGDIGAPLREPAHPDGGAADGVHRGTPGQAPPGPDEQLRRGARPEERVGRPLHVSFGGRGHPDRALPER
jgi:hypothetical protein